MGGVSFSVSEEKADQTFGAPVRRSLRASGGTAMIVGMFLTSPGLAAPTMRAQAFGDRTDLSRSANHYHMPTGTELALCEPDQGAGILDAWQSDIERLVDQLGRLNDGWAGKGSVAPTAAVLSDIDAASVVLSDLEIAPIAEVDEGDGSVKLVWEKDERRFCLVFNGNNKVIGFITSFSEEFAPWSLPVDDDIRLADKLSDDNVLKIISF